jgi:hypothetical protein
MSDERHVVRQIAWRELFPWLNLFTALRLAISLRGLLLALLGLVLTTAGWRICAQVFSNAGDADFQAWLDTQSRWPIDDVQPIPPPEVRAPAIGGDAASPDWRPGQWGYGMPIVHAWRQLSLPFIDLFDPTGGLLRFTYSLLCGLWALVVWSFFGAAITRMAAVKLAREERLSWGQLLTYTRKKWPSYFTAPLFPLIGVLLATVPLALLGLLLRFDAGILIAGLLWPIALAAGIFMAILMIGLLFGWPLMWTTISSEGTDAFDALSRSYAYVYQRPLHFFFYVLVAALLGVLGWQIVSAFAVAVIDLSNWAISWGSGHAALDTLKNETLRMSLGSLGSAGATLILFWIKCVVLLAVANRKLLRLHGVASLVKEKFGSREKLLEQVRSTLDTPRRSSR